MKNSDVNYEALAAKQQEDIAEAGKQILNAMLSVQSIIYDNGTYRLRGILNDLKDVLLTLDVYTERLPEDTPLSRIE